MPGIVFQSSPGSVSLSFDKEGAVGGSQSRVAGPAEELCSLHAAPVLL